MSIDNPVDEAFYQAVGWLHGTLLTTANEKQTVVTGVQCDDGTVIPCSGTKPGLAHWIHRHPDELTDTWCVYPKQGKDGLTVFLSNRWLSPTGTDPIHNQFRIQGRVAKVRTVAVDGEDAVTIAIERNVAVPEEALKNRPAWKNFFLKLQGSIDIASDAFVRVACHIDFGNPKLKLVIDAVQPITKKPKPKLTKKKPTTPANSSRSSRSGAPLPMVKPGVKSEVSRPVRKSLT